MTSTSGKLATGLKKCRPTNLLGSRSAPAQASSSSNARRVGRDQRRRAASAARGRANNARFASAFSTIASIDEIRGADLLPPRDRRAGARARHRPRRARAIVCETARARAPARARRTVARDPGASPSSPLQRAPRRDVAAHRAGADDVNAAHRGCPSARSCAAARAARTRARDSGRSA